MRADGFPYLSDSDVYFDNACQCLRPTQVIEAVELYYKEYNSCGERVKYKWGEKTDKAVEAVRNQILRLLKLSAKDYFVSFTQNTSYGINLLLAQFKRNLFKQVVISDIEHNSVFLPSITFAHNQGVDRIIVPRLDNDDFDISAIAGTQFNNSLVLVNTVSNIDGRQLGNIVDLVKTVHRGGGKIIIDAAQTIAGSSDLLQKTQADAICWSGHKVYAPSLGIMVVRKDLLDSLDISFIGGGMVDNVAAGEYVASWLSAQHIHSIFEIGLQNYSGIIGLGRALDWLDDIQTQQKKRPDESALVNLYKYLYEWLQSQPKIELVNSQASAILTFHVKGTDSHLLAKALSHKGIMARSGYFCCHYYLDVLQHYPPLLRISLGYHNNRADVDMLIEVLSKLVA